MHEAFCQDKTTFCYSLALVSSFTLKFALKVASGYTFIPKAKLVSANVTYFTLWNDIRLPSRYVLSYAPSTILFNKSNADFPCRQIPQHFSIMEACLINSDFVVLVAESNELKRQHCFLMRLMSPKLIIMNRLAIRRSLPCSTNTTLPALGWT